MNNAQDQKSDEQEPAQEQSNTLIAAVIDKKTPQYIAQLIEAKADVNAADEQGNTALFKTTSLCYGRFVDCPYNIQTATILLNAKARPDIANNREHSPLFAACRNGALTHTTLLLENGAASTINMLCSHGNTPLHQACNLGYYKIASLLLCYKAQPNIQNKSGATPLLLACKNGHRNSVKVLLAAKAYPEIRDYQERSPFFEACLRGDQNILQEILPAYLQAEDAVLTRAVIYMLRTILPLELSSIIASYAHTFYAPANRAALPSTPSTGCRALTWDLG